MVSDFFEGWSVDWVELEHSLQELSQIGAHEIVQTFAVDFGVLGPEEVSSIGSDALVEWVIGHGTVEAVGLSSHHEQDDSEVEHIDAVSGVGFLLMEFWSHIFVGSEVGSQETGLLLSIHWSSETEISNFNVVILIKQDILAFKVSVAISTLMNGVHCIQDLFKEISALSLVKLSGLSNVVEKLSTLSQLQNKISLYLGTVTLFIVPFQLELELVGKIWMIKIFHDFSLLHDGLNLILSLSLVNFVLKDLGSEVLLGVWVLYKLDF